MVRVLRPYAIIIYGSANYPCLKNLEKKGIKIYSYPSRIASYFKSRGDSNE